MRIGVCLEALGLPIRQALLQTARLGIKGAQFSSLGELSPERLTDTGRRELRNLFKSFDLELTALFCPLRHGIDLFENQEPRLEHVRRVMGLAFELNTRRIVVQFPKIADDPESPRAKAMADAVRALGLHGDRVGVFVAFEIGFDPAEKVRDYLKSFDVGSLGINYDPVNMMLHGHDPVKNLLPLAGRILQVHARDARLSTVSATAAEVPLGAGDIDWLSFVGSLSAVDYRDWLIVDRETGGDKLADIAAGVQFLRRMMIAS
jgi:sugar phosphate isomerase/epimerase